MSSYIVISVRNSFVNIEQQENNVGVSSNVDVKGNVLCLKYLHSVALCRWGNNRSAFGNVAGKSIVANL